MGLVTLLTIGNILKTFALITISKRTAKKTPESIIRSLESLLETAPLYLSSILNSDSSSVSMTKYAL